MPIGQLPLVKVEGEAREPHFCYYVPKDNIRDENVPGEWTPSKRTILEMRMSLVNGTPLKG